MTKLQLITKRFHFFSEHGVVNIVIVANRWHMFMDDFFCSSKCNSKQAWQNSSLHCIMFTHTMASLRVKISNDVIVTLSNKSDGGAVSQDTQVRAKYWTRVIWTWRVLDLQEPIS